MVRRWRGWLVAVAVFGGAACVAAACGGDDSRDPAGSVCALGVTAQPGEVVLRSSADCASGQCLKTPVEPGKTPPPGFVTLSADHGLCTAGCESAADCEAAAESVCVTGFACGTPVVVGDACCRRMCICADYVIVPSDGMLPVPPACDPGNAANSCCNLEGRSGNPSYPNCP